MKAIKILIYYLFKRNEGKNKAARQQGSKAARQQGSKAARQQGKDYGLVVYDASYV
jgi:hypothetical protein